MKILLHSSKTMKPVVTSQIGLTLPLFEAESIELNKLLASYSVSELSRLMNVSVILAEKVAQQTKTRTAMTPSAAALTFRGDIYSGLSADKWTQDDALYAQEHLIIMSGLYGLLRPFDGIRPYRLEMGYPLKLEDGMTLTQYWERRLERSFNPTDSYVNLTAYEYFKVIEKSLARSTVIAPKFLTVSPKTGEATFVTVHTKIARGAFANWMIKNRVQDPKDLPDFNELGYHFAPELSTTIQPVYVCQSFGGIGLSVRLT